MYLAIKTAMEADSENNNVDQASSVDGNANIKDSVIKLLVK